MTQPFTPLKIAWRNEKIEIKVVPKSSVEEICDNSNRRCNLLDSDGLGSVFVIGGGSCSGL